MPDQENAIVDVHIKVNNMQRTPAELKKAVETAVNALALEPGETAEIQDLNINEAR